MQNKDYPGNEPFNISLNEAFTNKVLQFLVPLAYKPVLLGPVRLYKENKMVFLHCYQRWSILQDFQDDLIYVPVFDAIHTKTARLSKFFW